MSSTTDDARTHLLVQAGAYRCALPLDRVQRVVPSLVVTPLPGTAAAVLGIATHLGEPLAVLDLAALAKAPPGPHTDHPVVIVASVGPADAPELVGLAADAALDIVSLPEDGITPSQDGVTRGEASVAGEVVRVIDPVALANERR